MNDTTPTGKFTSFLDQIKERSKTAPEVGISYTCARPSIESIGAVIERVIKNPLTKVIHIHGFDDGGYLDPSPTGRKQISLDFEATTAAMDPAAIVEVVIRNSDRDSICALLRAVADDIDGMEEKEFYDWFAKKDIELFPQDRNDPDEVPF